MSETKEQRLFEFNQKMSTIELYLPSHLKEYSQELKDKIIECFSFRSMNSELKSEIDEFIHEFFRKKGEDLI